MFVGQRSHASVAPVTHHLGFSADVRKVVRNLIGGSGHEAVKFRLLPLVILLAGMLSVANCQQSAERRAKSDFWHDRPVIYLMVAGELAAQADLDTTFGFPGPNREANPVTRPFVDGMPQPLVSAVSAGGVLGLGWLAHRMHQSNNRVLRKIWWVPQAIQGGADFGCAVENAANLGNMRSPVVAGGVNPINLSHLVHRGG